MRGKVVGQRVRSVVGTHTRDFTHQVFAKSAAACFIEEQIVGRNRDVAEEPVAEAAFALLYFQRSTDLIPDSIPGMGLLDDAIIVRIVLDRHKHELRYRITTPRGRARIEGVDNGSLDLAVVSHTEADIRRIAV